MNIVEVNYNWKKPWANISTGELKNDETKAKGGEKEQEGRKCYFLCFKTGDFSSSDNVKNVNSLNLERTSRFFFFIFFLLLFSFTVVLSITVIIFFTHFKWSLSLQRVRYANVWTLDTIIKAILPFRRPSIVFPLI